MALTKDRRTPIKAQGTHRHHRCKVAAAVKCIKGGIAAKNAAGYLLPASDTAALKVVGIFEETVDNTAGDAGDLEASYITGVEVELENAGGITQAITQAYVVDDQTVTSAAIAANDIFVGPVTEFTSSKATVIIDEAVNLSPPASGTPFDGADLGTVADANAVGGVPVCHSIAVPDGASGDTDLVITEKFEVTHIEVIKTGGAGAATNTITVKNGATAITDAIDMNVADKITAEPTTIDDAQSVIAAAGTLRVSHVKGGGNSAAKVFVYGIKRA